MAGGLPLLHETICFLCRPTMPGFFPYGCGKGASSELEDGQVSGKAIHAGAVEASGYAWAEGDWH